MISKFFVQIEDEDTFIKYQEDIKAYYSKIVPIAASGVIMLSIAIEVLNRLSFIQSPLLSNVTSAVNWCCSALMILMSFLVWKYYYTCILVGPMLTVYAFYYFCVVEFSGHIYQIYNVIVSGITISYFFLVFYCENWLANSIVIVPVFSLLLWRQSSSLDKGD